jgi:hypothetical protein
VHIRFSDVDGDNIKMDLQEVGLKAMDPSG